MRSTLTALSIALALAAGAGQAMEPRGSNSHPSDMRAKSNRSPGTRSRVRPACRRPLVANLARG